MLAREASAIVARSHRTVHLGRNHHLVARGHLGQPSPGRLFANALRVHVCRVEEIYSRFERDLEVLARLIRGEHPIAPLLVAIAHASEADARYCRAGFPKFGVFHDYSSEAARLVEPRAVLDV